MNYQISPSILSADFCKLSSEIENVRRCGINMLHIDVMDGHFVPNITIGVPVVKSLRKLTDMVLDVHLMIKHPQKFVKAFSDAGSDIITVHAESDHNLSETIKLIKETGSKAGVAINPDTPFNTVKHIVSEIDMLLVMTVFPGFSGQEFIFEAIDKVREAREYIGSFYKLGNDRNGLDIQVDGGINDKTIISALEAGANIFVAGSYVFGAEDVSVPIEKLNERIQNV